MSADNWASCPKCESVFKKDLANLSKKLIDEYGVISKEEYNKLEKKHDDLESSIRNSPNTLREDYEIGIIDGVFFYNYSGSCRDCDFSVKFSEEKELNV